MKMKPPVSSIIKQLLKKILLLGPSKYYPFFLLQRLQLYYADLSAEQAFTEIYKQGLWGVAPDRDHAYFSGSGSHDPVMVNTYVNAVERFLTSFKEKPTVVDLGCGDFSIGSKVRPFCGRYIACDIVKPVIKFNRNKYKGMNVDFRVLDLTKDALPEGDIVFIRQVLQHLSNRQIQEALPKIASQYKYLVLTEHLPASEEFIPNLDKAHGPDIRLSQQSGIVLTVPPFNLNAMEVTHLCEAPEYGGVVRTYAYQLS